MKKFITTAFAALLVLLAVTGFSNSGAKAADTAEVMKPGEWYSGTLKDSTDSFTIVPPTDKYFYYEVIVYNGHLQASLWRNFDNKEYISKYIYAYDGMWTSRPFYFGGTKKLTLKLDGRDAEYKVRLMTDTKKNFEKENNNTAKRANTIKKGIKYCGLSDGDNGDIDWYVFTAPATGKYKGYITGLSTSVSYEIWQNPVKKLFWGNCYYTDGQRYIWSARLKKGEKIYFAVTGYTINSCGFYNIKIK